MKGCLVRNKLLQITEGAEVADQKTRHVAGSSAPITSVSVSLNRKSEIVIPCFFGAYHQTSQIVPLILTASLEVILSMYACRSVVRYTGYEEIVCIIIIL